MEGYKIVKPEMQSLRKSKALFDMLISEADCSKLDIVVDMGNIGWIDSSSLNDIVSFYSHLKEKGEEKRIALTNLQERAEDTVVNLVKINSIIKIYKTNYDYLRQRT